MDDVTRAIGTVGVMGAYLWSIVLTNKIDHKRKTRFN